MYYPEEVVEEVRGKTDIVDIISGYLKLSKKGSSYFGLCPFHHEKSPSFSVSSIKQMYYCFGCGAGGNVFSFLMNYENLTFPEAVEELAKRAGVVLPEGEYSAEAKQEANKKAVLLAINKEAAKYFYYQLRSQPGEAGYQYLRNRGLSERILQRFGLGFANKTSNDLVLYLQSKGYEDEQIIQAGLASWDERYGVHDKFWNRVIFPIMDVNNRAIGFGGRVLGEGMPKYLNSPETPIFDKSRNLYGLNFARTARTKQIILCEGYMDVIALHQAGFTQAVASLGTAFTSGQANLLRRYTQQVLLAYDSDSAGVKAALRALAVLRENGLSGKVIALNPYKDPDEFIRGLGKEAFQERIDQAENGFLFEIRIMQEQYHVQDPEEKTAFYREIAAKLCRFEEEVERSNYLDAVAERYGIERQDLQKMVQTYAAQTGLAKVKERPKSGIQSRQWAKEGGRRIQRVLITWLTEEPDLYQEVKSYLSAADFTDELYQKVAVSLFAGFQQGNFSPARLISQFPEEVQREVAELFNTKIALPDREEERRKAFFEIVLHVKEDSLEEAFGRQSNDVNGLKQVLLAKKECEELRKKWLNN